jgi:PKD repeat protein
MASKLTEITTKYHTFVDNQVLTKDQLNEFVTYFDDQDRLSRVFLHGVGVVCGFKVSKSGAKITITPGTGITTDGDLIQLKETVGNSDKKKLAQKALTFSFYKEFDDDSANYQPFRKLIGKTKLSYQVVDLYELLSDESENSKPLGDLADLNNMAVLLYLESFAKEGDLCTAINCDNQGIEQVNRLRVLLVSKADAEIIAGKDGIFSSNNLFENYFKLPSLAVPRVILNQQFTSENEGLIRAYKFLQNTSEYETLKKAYYTALNTTNLVSESSVRNIKIFDEFKKLKNTNLVSKLADAMDELTSNFGVILQLELSKTQITSGLLKLKSLLGFKEDSVPFDFQYRYDLAKDLVDTYNEIKELLLSLQTICIPDITAFPKHLMLGLLSEINVEPKQLRHHFYKSPASTSACDKILEAKSLVSRFFDLINQYETSTGTVRITPSNKLPILGKRSIPFYYNISANLLKSWDFFKTKRFGENTNLSYHTEKLAELVQIKEPLFYNTDRFDFYRIEGHQGKDYRDVLEDIDTLKTKYGLAFDVKALSININSENLDVDDYECEFEDLTVLLNAWTAEQDCILAQVSSFFSGFSTKVPGANIKEAELDLVKEKSIGSATLSNFSAAKFTTAKTTAASMTSASFLNQPLVTTYVVSDNLVTTVDTLGAEMKVAFDENKGGSVNDIIASASARLKDKVNTDEWNADPDLKEFVVNKSVELMAYSHVLSQRMPLAVSVVDTTSVTSYKLSLTQLCSLVQKLKASYQSIQLSVGLRAFMGLLINQLATVCCSGKKLEVLLEEVNKRKDQILLRLQLSSFIEKNKGLEHLAGVQPGGTFILVYKNKEVVSDEKSISEKLTSSSFLSASNLTAAKTSILSSVPDNTVVADFALPYMCCSNCAPINYIISKPAASLRLEKDKYCLLSDTEPILFEVSPADGEVQMNPLTSGIKIEGNKIVLIPNSFPNDMLGKPIRFTVNSQVTDALLIVYSGIQADFKVPEKPTDEDTFTFTPTGNLDGATFLWEFGDGNTSTQQIPTHTYSLPVNDDNLVTVRLSVTASNGVCKTVVEHDISFLEIKPTISITPDQFCENDKSSYPFVVIPSNSKVEIKGDGVQRDDAGDYYFIPAAAKVGTITFLLNGVPSGVSVTVNAAPKALCTPEQVGNQLVLNNNSKNASQFVWLINDNKYETDSLAPVVVDLTPNSPNEWKIVLTATGADVCSSSRTSLSFSTKYIDEPPVNNCIEEAEAMIRTDLKILQNIKPLDTGIVGDIWQKTLAIYGGSSDYKEGVLDQVDAFLEGGLNDRLVAMFSKLISQTASMIAEMRGQDEIVAQLVLLFELQLRLFYNVLGCQKSEVIEKYREYVETLLKQILELLSMLQELKIAFSDTMKKYIEAYAEKVIDLLLVGAHTKVIIEKKLI